MNHAFIFNRSYCKIALRLYIEKYRWGNIIQYELILSQFIIEIIHGVRISITKCNAIFFIGLKYNNNTISLHNTDKF